MGSAMVPCERTMLASCMLDFVTISLSLTIWPYFAIECVRRSNRQGWVILGRNLGRKGKIDVSQIFTQSRRIMGLLYVEEIVLISSAV